jgi:hypothetical protein
VSLEDDLGFQTNGRIFRLDGFYRFNRRHGIYASWYDIKRDSKATLEEDLEWGEEVFPVDAKVKATFDTMILKASYRYNLVARDDWELGLSAGLHWMRLETSLEVTGESLELDLSESARLDLPLPVLGLHVALALHPRVRMRLSTEAILAELGVYKGYIIDTYLGIEWDIWDNFGVGISYNGFVGDVDIDQGGFDANVRYSYHAILLGVRVFF